MKIVTGRVLSEFIHTQGQGPPSIICLGSCELVIVFILGTVSHILFVSLFLFSEKAPLSLRPKPAVFSTASFILHFSFLFNSIFFSFSINIAPLPNNNNHYKNSFQFIFRKQNLKNIIQKVKNQSNSGQGFDLVSLNWYGPLSTVVVVGAQLDGN